VYYYFRSLMDPSKSIGFLKPQEIGLADQCFPRPQCDFFNMYRTIDGSCNNLLYPTWGQTNTANTRIIQANYSDGKYFIEYLYLNIII